MTAQNLMIGTHLFFLYLRAAGVPEERVQWGEYSFLAGLRVLQPRPWEWQEAGNRYVGTQSNTAYIYTLQARMNCGMC